jgi:RecQ family ATP-dependent DNA helicase
MDQYERSKSSTQRYKDVKTILRKNFGHDKFKPYQYQIIDNVLDLKDVIAVMPTGYGKSLCFQIIPIITNEVAIVISPLIALMTDQKMILDNLGITSCCYNSTISQKKKSEMEKGLINGEYKIMYTTPESLINCRQLINEIYKKRGICMVAIDEAHCISSYGFDFRPAYKKIVSIRSLLTNVPILAVTATATEKVIIDIKTLMEIKNCELIRTSFDRPNLILHVNMQYRNTIDKIIDIINNSTGPCIVYCLTKSDTEKLSEIIKESGVDSMPYHAGLKKEERFETQSKFMKGEYKCITATIAFGMGINKADIRTIIHYGCPQNIESYYQEIGRAGRDGKESNCYLFYKQKDFIIQQKFIDDIKDTKYKQIRMTLLHQMSRYVSTSECRRKYILNYFGQNIKENKCDHCDNCMLHNAKKIDIKDEIKLFQLLSTILTIETTNHFSFGSNVISLILKGSNSVKIKSWMKKLPYFASMHTLSLKNIIDFIHKSIDLGYLEDHDVGNCVRVLKCTNNGIEFGKIYEEKLNEMVNDKNDDVLKLLLE